METKFHDLDVKATELTTTVEHLQHEVDSVKIPDSSDDDDDSPLRTTTQFTTQTRLVGVPVPKGRPSSPTQASTPFLAPPVSTPLAQATSTKAFFDALLSTPTSATGGDRA